MPETTYAGAIQQALFDAAHENRSVLFLAEGAHDARPVFGTLPTPADGIDPAQLIEMPTAENAIVGAAVGLALGGYRPIVSFHRVEFALLAMEQIVNNLGKLPWASNGRLAVPVLIRLVVGRGWGQGPVHAQSLEAMFAMLPGIAVTMPVTPQDAYSLTAWALEQPGPVIQIESRWCHGLTEDIEPAACHDAATPRQAATGTALTIVATGYAAIEARRAAAALAGLGHAPDLFVLRTLRPLDLRSVTASVARTGRILFVDTGHRLFGIGAEVVTQIMEGCGEPLRTPPRRIGLYADFVASSRHLIAGTYPSAVDIYRTATGMLALTGAEQLDAAQIELDSLAAKGPIDQPDPSFRGPF